MAFEGKAWAPNAMEAVLMSGIYGLVTLLLIFLLTGIITPAPDDQLRGWRRARKQGLVELPRLADATTAFWVVILMAITGATGWLVFARALVESRWFPGHLVPLSTWGFFVAVVLAGGVGFHGLLEAKGLRVVGLVTIFVGVVPVMAGSVVLFFGDLNPSQAVSSRVKT